MVRHYRSVDPHAKVATSKTGFYHHALQHLDATVARRPRRLLDVGCGYGYFLEKAKAFGWETIGVEIVPEAVNAARHRVSSAAVWCGDLRAVALPADSIDAVTLWDVLCHVDNPPAEIQECHRILAPGGVIGIRVRNLTSQLWLCRWFFRLYQLWPKLGVRPLHVFHRYNFTPRALERLLASQGFIDIRVHNSRLTTGSPYHYFRPEAAIGLGKFVAEALSGLAWQVSHARWIIGPSLLGWARKP
jgi:SAM-dependent methyltransferase